LRSTEARRPTALLLAAFLALGAACPAAAAERLEIGAKYGTIDFAIGNSKVFRTTGSFTNWQGTVNVDDANVQQSSVDVVVKTTSIQMLDEQQTNMLKDSDYFDVARFPEMTFHSTHVERTGENSLKVDGNITLRGVTRPMTLVVTVTDRQPQAAPGARYARFRGVGTVKRSEFGMTKYIDMVGDNVEISIATEARRH
jgi:polyisoprenoid-binding protein YceI